MATSKKMRAVPKGSHRMPDGSVMKNSAHKMSGKKKSSPPKKQASVDVGKPRETGGYTTPPTRTGWTPVSNRIYADWPSKNYEKGIRPLRLAGLQQATDQAPPMKKKSTKAKPVAKKKK